MECDVKFALLPQAPAALARCLARVPILSQQKPSRCQVRDVYFDTQDQQVQRNHMALRIRHLACGAAQHWMQTLHARQDAASVPGQLDVWEAALQNGVPDLAQLQGTPWSGFDPEEAMHTLLVPQFAVNRQRSRWMVDVAPHSSVELVLDIGTLEAQGVSAPVYELGLRLVSGKRQVLFDVAKLISASVALIPLYEDTSQRGYQLVHGTSNVPLRASAPCITSSMALPQLAATTLRDMFVQFTANLNLLRLSDDPEVLHQARIGWRRFKSALQLFKKHPALHEAPSQAALRPLLAAMTVLRDLDVAGAETLPMLANAYTAGEPKRQQQWQAMERALAKAAARQRKPLLAALEAPAIGASLVDTMHWLELQLPTAVRKRASLRPQRSAEWLQGRMVRMHAQLVREPLHAADLDVQHRVRLLSKRLRYCVEALRPVLPQGRSKRWLQEATRLQNRIGATRDMANAVEIVARLKVDSGIVEFLRGVVFGERMHAK